jgi:hypothetical protein
MKALQSLTKDELISFIYNHPPGEIDIFEEAADCASCGTVAGTKYWFICDSCNEIPQKKNEAKKKLHEQLDQDYVVQKLNTADAMACFIKNRRTWMKDSDKEDADKLLDQYFGS